MPLVERDGVLMVDLPTYDVVQLDVAARRALVDVPDRDLPPHPLHRAALVGPSWERAELPRQLHAAALDAWHAHLDARYQEHAGRFRPQLP